MYVYIHIFVTFISEFVTFDNEIYSTRLRHLTTRRLVHDGNMSSCLDLAGQKGRFRTRVYTQKPASQFQVTVTKSVGLPCGAVKVMETQSEMDGQEPVRFVCPPTAANDTQCVFSCPNKLLQPTNMKSDTCQVLVVDAILSTALSGVQICSISMA